MKKVLVTTPFTEDKKQQLVQDFPEVQFVFEVSAENLQENLKNVNALIGNQNTAVLGDKDNLEWIQLHSSGADAYALPGAVAENTVVTCATGAYGHAISEYMVGMLLAMMKKIPGYLETQKTGKWVDLGHVETPANKRILLVGCGNIGLEFAKRMKAFGCTLVGIRNRSDICPPELDAVYPASELKDQVALADVIAISLPGTAACYHMFNKEVLLACKEGAYIMNVGRGNVIDTSAFLDETVSSRFGGIWLDVMEQEPLPDNDPLYYVPGLLLTPHITGGFHLDETSENIFNIAEHNLKAWLTDKNYIHVVSKEGYSLN